MTFLRFVELASSTAANIELAQRLITAWAPVGSLSSLTGPLVAIGSVLMLALVTGVAVGSLATLLVAAILLYRLLTEVFGISIELVVPA
jgi:hypothetical protein